MTYRPTAISFLTLVIILALAGLAFGLDVEYTDYKSPKTNSEAPYFEISFSRSYVEFITYDAEGEATSTGYYRRDFIHQNKKVLIDDRVIIDNDGLYVNDTDLQWGRIYSVKVTEVNNRTLLSFQSKDDDTRSVTRIRRNNIFEYTANIEIDADEFIRGSVIAVLGDIRLDGEVNRDIIALFGDIRLGSDAVARGDVVAMTGHIDIAKSASIYGELFETKSDERTRAKRRGRRGRFYRNSRVSDITSGFIYNRVDGAHTWSQFKFIDSDSLLPTVALRAGYAFNSKRWRYDVSVEQTVLRNIPITIGLGLHRRLETEDKWLISEEDNTVYAIVAKEDYLDYYEAEGSSAYIRIKPLRDLTLEGRYQYDQTKWLPASHNLWTIFGGDKKFDNNFGTVEDGFRTIGISEINTMALGSFIISGRFDNVDRDDSSPYSGTRASIELEWSDPQMDSDFDYNRYTLAATHHMRLNRRAMLSLGARYGSSSGYLPMHKRFYLGGLSTLRGYKYKEFIGTEFWLANAEYRFELPGTSMDFALLYDVAQIANEENLKDAEALHSVGLSLYLSDDFILTVAKRLDGAENDNPRFQVRITGGVNWGGYTGW